MHLYKILLRSLSISFPSKNVLFIKMINDEVKSFHAKLTLDILKFSPLRIFRCDNICRITLVSVSDSLIVILLFENNPKSCLPVFNVIKGISEFLMPRMPKFIAYPGIVNCQPIVNQLSTKCQTIVNKISTNCQLLSLN